jgi:arylsulfatase A-like enzyme
VSPEESRNPDVLIIVMDAVRSGDVYADRDGTIDRLPFLSRFAREAAVFPRAASVAPWTLPSVASLMTGLYPWEHGLSALGGSYLSPGTRTLARILRDRGYSTLLLSANNVVGPRTNLSEGFEHRYVGDWWEMYFRLVRPTPSQLGATVGETPPEGARPAQSVSRRTVMRRGVRLALRLPMFTERASLLAQHLRNPGRPAGIDVSPWIEPTFHDHLVRTPRSQPILCVMHLNDAHEPYYRAPGHGSGNDPEHLRMVRQDFMHQIEGRWAPNDRELAALHELYRGMIRSLDRRLERLISDFAATRGLDNAVVVITADHGQAFGEGGWLFHMNSPDEALLRVPLIVRFPGSALRGRGTGWASTVDIFPTVLEAAGLDHSLSPQGQPLQSLFGQERPGPAWAISDGLPVRHLEGIVAPPTLRTEVAKRGWLVAYEGDLKVVYDLNSHRFEEQRVTVPGTAPSAGGPETAERREELRAETLRVADLLASRRDSVVSDEVSQRLESWGYGV